MHVLILLALLFAPPAQDVTTIRECMVRDGYTSSTFEIIQDAGYRVYLQTDLVDYDLEHLLDTPGVEIGPLHEQVLEAGSDNPRNYVTFLVHADGVGASMPVDADQDVSELRAGLYRRFGENRRVTFIVADVDRSGHREVYAYVWAHLYEPLALSRREDGDWGWHGDCMLRLQWGMF